MIASDFTRDDCQVGKRRISYAKLTREYVCNECGGRLVEAYGDNTWLVRCGRCKASDFIHELAYKRAENEGDEVLDGLPENLRALLADEDSPAARRDAQVQAGAEKRDRAMPTQHSRGSSVLFKT